MHCLGGPAGGAANPRPQRSEKDPADRIRDGQRPQKHGDRFDPQVGFRGERVEHSGHGFLLRSHNPGRIAQLGARSELKSVARRGLAERHPGVRISGSILPLFMVAVLLADDPSAAELYRRGRIAEQKGHMAQAYLMYSEAAAKDPSKHIYWQRSQAVRSRASLESKVTPEVLAA